MTGSKREPVYPIQEVRMVHRTPFPADLDHDTPLITLQRDSVGRWWVFSGTDPVREVSDREFILAMVESLR